MLWYTAQGCRPWSALPFLLERDGYREWQADGYESVNLLGPKGNESAGKVTLLIL